MPRLNRNLPLFSFALALCVAAGVPAKAGAPQIPAETQSQVQNQQRNQRNSPQQPASSSSPLGTGTDSAPDPFRASMDARRLRMQNDDRYKRMVTDTEKLLALSTELKEDVSKANKNELSLDVIKKAAEIEKLAHDVKERMRS